MAMLGSNREHRLRQRIEDHQAAVREFVDRARVLTDAQWLAPRAEGKWTPAQETRHVMLVYEGYNRELAGGPGVRVRASGVRRLLARWIGLSSILYRRKIPIAVGAPREVRPEWEATPRDTLIEQLQQRTREFDGLFVEKWRTDPDRLLTHPLFGGVSLDQIIVFLAVHTRHHGAFLPGPNQRGISR